MKKNQLLSIVSVAFLLCGIVAAGCADPRSPGNKPVRPEDLGPEDFYCEDAPKTGSEIARLCIVAGASYEKCINACITFCFRADQVCRWPSEASPGEETKVNQCLDSCIATTNKDHPDKPSGGGGGSNNSISVCDTKTDEGFDSTIKEISGGLPLALQQKALELERGDICE